MFTSCCWISGRNQCPRATVVQDSQTLSADQTTIKDPSPEQGQQSFGAWLGAHVVARTGQFLSPIGRIFTFGKHLAINLFLAPIGKVLVAIVSFVNSRRWLVGAVMVTGALLAVLAWTRPTSQRPFLQFTHGPDIVFNDVKRLPVSAKSAGSPLNSTSGPESRTTDLDLKSLAKSNDLTLGSSDVENAKNNDPRRLSRRLDVVRFRKARGAWLIGKIEDVAGSSSPHGRSASAGPDSPVQQHVIQEQTVLPRHAAVPPSATSVLQ